MTTKVEQGHFERSNFTPKEAAYAIAIDALINALYARGELAEERPAYRALVDKQIRKLLQQLGNKSTLDFMIPTAKDVEWISEH
jgi:hypothetical protein